MFDAAACAANAAACAANPAEAAAEIGRLTAIVEGVRIAVAGDGNQYNYAELDRVNVIRTLLDEPPIQWLAAPSTFREARVE